MSTGADNNYDVEIRLSKTGSGAQDAVGDLQQVSQAAGEMGEATERGVEKGGGSLKELGEKAREAGHGLREGAHIAHGLEMAMGAASFSVRGLILAIRALWAAMFSNPITAVVAAVLALGVAMFEVAKRHQEAKEKIEESHAAIQEAVEKTQGKFLALAAAKTGFEEKIEEAKKLKELYDGIGAAIDKIQASQDKLQDAKFQGQLSDLHLQRSKALEAAGGDEEAKARINQDYAGRELQLRSGHDQEKADAGVVRAQSAYDRSSELLEQLKAAVEKLGTDRDEYRNRIVGAPQRAIQQAGIAPDDREPGYTGPDTYAGETTKLNEQLDELKKKKKGADDPTVKFITARLKLLENYEAAVEQFNEGDKAYTEQITTKKKEISDAEADQYSKKTDVAAAQVTAGAVKTENQAKGVDNTAQGEDLGRREQAKDEEKLHQAAVDAADRKKQAIENEISALQNEIDQLDKDSPARIALINQRAALEKRLQDADNNLAATQGHWSPEGDQATAQKKRKADVDAANDVKDITDKGDEAAWKRAMDIEKVDGALTPKGQRRAPGEAPHLDLHGSAPADFWGSGSTGGQAGGAGGGTGDGGAAVVAAVKEGSSSQEKVQREIADAIRTATKGHADVGAAILSVMKDQQRQIDDLKGQLGNMNGR